MIESDNIKRGLAIVRTQFKFFKQGAFAAIFVDRQQRRARKIFWAPPDFSKEHLHEIFNLEISAYELAMKEPDLRSLVPQFFGRSGIEGVVEASGKDVSAEFRCDLSYEMEFIEGDFVKINSLPLSDVSSEEIDRIKRLFLQCGIQHVTDASVLVESGKIVKILDFAEREIELWHRD